LGKRAKAIALSGDLGAGKTTFAQGFLRELGVRGRVTSPTFVLIKQYKISQRFQPPTSNFRHIHHADFYRLGSAAHLKPLEFKKILNDPQNIVLIEWPEKVKGAIPKNAIKILFQHGEKENERTVTFINT
jgi:tRNA threonylcarbamoyladenosine biosynthesis protein TsaE